MSNDIFDDFFNNDPIARQILSDDQNDKKNTINSAIDSICAIEKAEDREIVEIPINSIEIHKQVRQNFNEDQLKELQDSIEENGLLTPITVTKIKDSSKYRLICGERRVRACTRLGYTSIRANIIEINSKDGITEDAQITVLQIIENLQRSDPVLKDYIEAIEFLSGIDNHISNEQIAKLISKSEDYVYRLQMICKLSEDEKEVVLPLGIKFIHSTYMPFKNAFEDTAKAYIESAIEYLNGKEERTSDIDDMLKAKIKKLYEDAKKKRDKAIILKDKVQPKRAKLSISLSSLNKRQKDLGNRVQQYMIDTESDFEETVANALDYFLNNLNK